MVETLDDVSAKTTTKQNNIYMSKQTTRGRRAHNEELAEILYSLSPGESVNVYGASEEAYTLANSLSRTTKTRNNTRFSVRAKKAGGVKITCILNKKPGTVIVI